MTETLRKDSENMNYQKITQEDLYKLLARLATDCMNPIGGTINLKNLAQLMKTSRYQVKKYMNELQEKEFVELVCLNLSDEEELYPPYWGYVLTAKGKDTDTFRKIEVEANKLFEAHFAI